MDKKFIFKFGAVEFTYYFACAAYMYLTTYLDSVGYTLTQVGLITTAVSVVAMLTSPLIGSFADYLRSSSKAAMIVIGLFATTYALVPLTIDIKILGLAVGLVFVVISRIFYGPSGALMETSVIKACKKTNTDYGVVRTFGSISWIIMSFFLGKFIVSNNAYLTPYIMGFFFIPCIFAIKNIVRFADDEIVEEKKNEKLPYGKLLKNPYFIVFLIFSICKFIPMMSSTTYQAYLIKEVGGDMGKVGLISAFTSSFEFPILLLSGKLLKKISLRNMFILAAISDGIRMILLFRATCFNDILFASIFGGISLGFANSSAYKYVFTMAPKELQSTAQTMYGSCNQAAYCFSHHWYSFGCRCWCQKLFLR